jgi:hypothetical protein
MKPPQNERIFMRIFLLFFLSMFCFSSFAVNLLPDWHGKNCIAEVGNGGRQYTVALKPEWRGIRLKSKMKATNILRGEETLTCGQCYVSPALCRCGTQEASDYRQMITDGLRKAVTGRGDMAEPELIKALQELESTPIYPEGESI